MLTGGPGCLLFSIVWSLTIDDSLTALPSVIRIGAIFTQEDKDSTTEVAFKYAVYRINKDQILLPNTTLVYDIEYVSPQDSFKASKKVCRLLENGVHVIFGPSDSHLAGHIVSICEAFSMPLLLSIADRGTDLSRRHFVTDMFPARGHLGQAYRDLIEFLNWTKIAIVYDNEDGLLLIQNLMKTSKADFYIRQVDPNTHRQVLKEIKDKHIYNVIVDVHSNNINGFFRSILQLQMNDYRYHFLFTTFDLETFDLEDFKYNSVNMTSYRIVDDENQKVINVLREMERFQRVGQNMLHESGVIRAEPALMYDAVNVFAHSIGSIGQSERMPSENISCKSSNRWANGTFLYDRLNAVDIEGLTGRIHFEVGKRSDIKLDLLKLHQEKVKKVGFWTPSTGINITKHSVFYGQQSSNVTLIVVTRIEKPYVMIKEDKNLTGNSKYEGFCIDLLHRIASQVGFHYAITIVPDNKYGAYDPTTKQWNGIVRELIDKKADLAMASMTINYARESVVDFTKPFMNTGIGILFKVPSNEPSKLFAFLNPLATSVWTFMLVAYLAVSLSMFFLGRFSPYEWRPHTEEKHRQNRFTISNCFWFVAGVSLKQDAGITPKATSARILGGIWWFFTIIIIPSYTANLTALRTVERLQKPIQNVAELSSQEKIAYGTLEGGSTMSFFRDSHIPIYKKMWEFMAKHNSAFVSTYDEGTKKVLEGNYAFLMESTMIDYAVQRDCNLTQISGLLDSKGYGIATPKGSVWRDKLSLAVLELQEKGVIQMLYDKWWKNAADICIKDEKVKEFKPKPLDLNDLGGVFVFVLCGLTVAVIVAILEFCWHSKKKSKDQQQSVCTEMAEELRYAIRCDGTKHKATLKRTCNGCSPITTYVPAPMQMNHVTSHIDNVPMIELSRPAISIDHEDQ
ncbi:glutamate receptor ionotropic, kainate 2-like [Adelges cooleyi]|uniref:glutamate receptor ionotropic, kainate 2-like n=1 Tax=Adelges cooleyi TaxID=133065 RepID=UPI00217FC5DB|nr:glutamate receptor ionotropic, kainate 2-like [Adelges cooleyi]